MAQKKVGFSNTSYIQGDKLIINNGLTASIDISWYGSTALSYIWPEADGTSGQSLLTDASGNLYWGTPFNGTITGGGSTPSLTLWTGTQSIGNSTLQEVGGQLLFPSGSTGSPAISFISDPDTGFVRTTTNTIGIVGGSTLYGQLGPNETFFNVGSNQVYISTGGGVVLDGVNGGVAISAATFSWVGHSLADGDLLYYDMLTQTIQGIGQNSFLGPTGPTGPQGPQGVQGPQGPTGADSTVMGPTGPTGSFTGQTFMYTAGEIAGASFSGTPLYYDVVFSFTASYNVFVNSEIPRDWSISNQTSNGFRINSNSTSPFTYSVRWSALEVNQALIGAISGPIGPVGPQGPTGADSTVAGPTGPTGPQGATGAGIQGPTGPAGAGIGNMTPITLADGATVSWDYSLGFNANVTINGNRNLSITGMTAGCYGTLQITQGSTGSYWLNFPTASRAPGNTYSFSPTGGRTDIYGIYYDGNFYRLTYNLNYYN